MANIVFKEDQEEKTPKKSFKENILILFIIAFLSGILGGFLGIKLGLINLNQSRTSPQAQEKEIVVKESSDVINVVKKVSSSVVSITGEQSGQDFFGQVFKTKSAGTGFIVSSNGLILTNKHVVSEQDATYSVFTADKKEFKAKVTALDPSNDLAFLKIDASNLPAVILGDSSKLEVGQRVIAIGNALGQYQNTVTSGIISAIGRVISAGDTSGIYNETLENVIQTDAAINLGNSGGPLVNLDGQVIGINTAIDQSGQLIGFALPVNVAKTAIASVLEKGKVVRPMIGIRYVPITKEISEKNDLKVNEGALIYSSNNQLAIVPGSPASKADLKEGDIIIKINDTRITPEKSLASIIQDYKVGDKVTLTVLRDDKEIKVDLVLAEMD